MHPHGLFTTLASCFSLDPKVDVAATGSDGDEGFDMPVELCAFGSSPYGPGLDRVGTSVLPRFTIASPSPFSMSCRH
jgi:hypothetical protein